MMKRVRCYARIKMLPFLLLSSIVGMLCILPGCAWTGEEAVQPELKVLTIGTADTGGTMYPVGKAISQVINEHTPSLIINTSASNGSYTNVENLRAGQVDLALISSHVAYNAYEGLDEFEHCPMKKLRSVGSIYLSMSNWMAPEELGVEYVHDLVGKRLAVGPEDSTTELCARIALEALGIGSDNTTLENKGLGSGAISLKREELDALHAFAGVPVRGLSDLAAIKPCRVLRYTDEEIDIILSKHNQYIKTIIPAGTYVGQTEDVETFGVKCLLCVSADMDDELVNKITQIIWESAEELKKLHPTLSSLKDDFMYQDSPIPLHAGAEQFYRSMDLLANTPR